MVNVDAIASILGERKSKIHVRGIIDSGWFLDNDPFFNNDASKTGVGPSSVKHALQKGVQMWNAKVPSSCAEEYPDLWECFLGYKVFPFIKSKFYCSTIVGPNCFINPNRSFYLMHDHKHPISTG